MKKLITVKPNGAFGVEGIDVKELDAKIYMCIVKLKDYERTELNPDEVEALQYAHEDAIAEIESLKRRIESLKEIINYQIIREEM